MNNISTTAGCHRTQEDAARAIDALLLHHGKRAVNFPGEEEAARARRSPTSALEFLAGASRRPPRAEAAPAPEGAARGAKKPAPNDGRPGGYRGGRPGRRARL